MKENRNRLVIIAAVGLLLPLSFWGVVEFTSRPKFCNSCHYMEPFYESWAASAHGDVTCTKCHFEPGLTGKLKGKLNGLYQLTKYVSLAYKKSKPWAEISDKSCLRKECHQAQKLVGPIQFKNVKFDHSHHLGELRRGKQLRCTSCHSQMVQGQHIKVTEATCFICHMKDRSTNSHMVNCNTCHTDEIFIERGSELRYNHTTVIKTGKDCQSCHVNTIEGNAPVPLNQCINCHWQTTFFERYDDPEFLHEYHVANNKIECVACHTPIQHTIRREHRLTGEDCRSCHLEMHTEQARMFAGEVSGLPHTPNPMFEAGLSCQSCHIFHLESLGLGETMVSSPEACDQCHGQGYGHLLQNWERRLEEMESEVGSYLEETRATLDGKGKLSPPLELYLSLAAKNLLLVTTANGIHNIKLSDILLEQAHDLISQALQNTGEETSLRPYVSSGQLVPSDCANCHFGIEETVVDVYGLKFQHNSHLTNGVTCTKCHSNLQVHGELLLSREECLNCHHSREELACSSCHLEQSQLLQGQTPFFSGEPDLMWGEDVSCQDCHLVESGLVRRSAELCADCHDEDYPALVLKWRAEITTLIRTWPAERDRDVVEWLTQESSLGGHNAQAVIDYLQSQAQIPPRP